ENDQRTSQSLSEAFTVQATPGVAPTNPSPQIPDVGTPNETIPGIPFTPGQAVEPSNGDQGEVKPVAPGTVDEDTQEENIDTTDEESVEVAANMGMNERLLQAIVVSTYAATAVLAILFIREAYKELSRVHHLRAIL